MTYDDSVTEDWLPGEVEVGPGGLLQVFVGLKKDLGFLDRI